MHTLPTIMFAMAKDLHSGILGLKRHDETNKEWGETLKARVQTALNTHVTKLVEEQSLNLYLLDMPYIAGKGSGRGGGQDVITAQKFIPYGENPISEDALVTDARIIERLTVSETEKRTYCLIDIIDGTWNASCGLLFSCSTMLAFTPSLMKQPGDLTLADFHSGFILPYHGPGLYVGQFQTPTLLLSWDGGSQQLQMSPVTDVSKARVILDLFTEENKDALAQAILSIGPVMYDWCDYGRFYGAGAEIAALFGYRNLVPGFAAYVAASQKMDNIVPTYAVVVGAGGIVTDWWGDPIKTKKLSESVHIIMAANKTLHAHLVQHLSKHPR